MTTTNKKSSKKSNKISGNKADDNKPLVNVELIQMNPPDNLLDMKLTRSELIELISEEIISDLHNQNEKIKKNLEVLKLEIEEEINNLPKEKKIEMLVERFKTYMNTYLDSGKGYGPKRFLLSHLQGDCNSDSGPTYKLSMNCFFHVADIDPNKEKIEQYRNLLNEKRAVEAKIYELSSKQGRNKILKQMLSSSEAGKRLVDEIANFKANILALPAKTE